MRFTPAHAGNTHVNAEEAGSLEVHPRSRGEYVDQNPKTWKKLGSSPLTRGIPPVPAMAPAALRFIPAHAGNTQTHRQELDLSWVHPRSRGEY